MPFYYGLCLKENYSQMLNTELDLYLVYDVAAMMLVTDQTPEPTFVVNLISWIALPTKSVKISARRKILVSQYSGQALNVVSIMRRPGDLFNIWTFTVHRTVSSPS